MKDQIKKFLNEDQDPKAIEKITSKIGFINEKMRKLDILAFKKTSNYSVS
jgi:hypothetical protein